MLLNENVSNPGQEVVQSGWQANKTSQECKNELLNAALGYAELGLPVFPCNIEKKPLTPHGFKDASTSVDQIKEWWNKWPDASIGMPAAKRYWSLGLGVRSTIIHRNLRFIGHYMGSQYRLRYQDEIYYAARYLSWRCLTQNRSEA